MLQHSWVVQILQKSSDFVPNLAKVIFFNSRNWFKVHDNLWIRPIAQSECCTNHPTIIQSSKQNHDCARNDRRIQGLFFLRNLCQKNIPTFPPSISASMHRSCSQRVAKCWHLSLHKPDPSEKRTMIMQSSTFCSSRRYIQQSWSTLRMNTTEIRKYQRDIFKILLFEFLRIIALQQSSLASLDSGEQIPTSNVVKRHGIAVAVKISAGRSVGADGISFGISVFALESASRVKICMSFRIW